MHCSLMHNSSRSGQSIPDRIQEILELKWLADKAANLQGAHLANHFLPIGTSQNHTYIRLGLCSFGNDFMMGRPWNRQVQQHHVNFIPVRTKTSDRRSTIGSFEYYMTSLTQHLDDSLAQGVLVLHNEDRALLSWHHHLLPVTFQAVRVCGSLSAGQQYFKRRPSVRLAP